MYLALPCFPTSSPSSMTTLPLTIVSTGIPSSSVPLNVEKSLLPCSSSIKCLFCRIPYDYIGVRAGLKDSFARIYAKDLGGVLTENLNELG